MHFFFDQEGFDALNAEIGKLCDRIKEAGAEMGGSCGEGAETFHDNFAYEQGERDQNMWSNRLRQLVKIRNSTRIVVPGPNKGKVSMGRLVTIRDGAGKEKVFRIGSYMVFKETKEGEIPTLSYDAPLPKALIGAEEGDQREVSLGGKKHLLEVIKIE